MSQIFRRLVAAFLLFAMTAGVSFAADSADAPDDMAFVNGLSLVVLDTEDIETLHLARRTIQSYGGTVAIMSPPSLIIGWIPPESRGALIGAAGIREIHDTEVIPEEIGTADRESAAAVRFFNRAVRGDIAKEHRDFAQTVAADGTAPPREPDMRDPEPVDEAAYLENLRAAGVDVGALKGGVVPGLSSQASMGNSDYMTGTVALTIFFVESDGSGSDPDQYTWTPEAMQHYLDGVYTAMAWWVNRAVTYGDCWVSFLIKYYSGDDPRCQQWVEPILHGTEYEETWVNGIMAKFGYTSGSRFTRVTAFNTWQRSYYQTNRSYSAFVPFNPAPAPAMFPDGMTAYAYWYGPYTVLLFHVQGWTTAQVFAHESGHIFGACDEYSGGCGSWSCTSVCSNGALNGNCEDCNPQSRDCMMKANSFSLCSYTPTQVGWGVNNPCAPEEPPLLPAPGLATISPGYGYHGLETDVTVTGSNLYAGVRLDLGPDVFVHTMTLTGQTTISAHVEIFRDAPPGPRDVRVINRDGQYTTLPGVFEVRLTSRHYYSPAGGNSYPYITPSSAATSLEEALDATYDGDSLFVGSGTFDNFSLIVNKGVLLYGGWNGTFTERNLATGKTVLNLFGNVTFVSSGGGAGIDGFILRNGTGAADVTPFPGYFGGAVRFVGGEAVVANCEIHSNSVGGTIDYGLGGAIYADGCAVDIRDNYIHGNAATQGGGICLRACSGVVSGNTIENNTLNSSPQPRVGGGIAVFESIGLTLAGNVITGNTLVSEGAGVYVENSTGVTVAGGAMSGNSASFSGGGAAIKGSEAVIDGVDFEGNTSGAIGGAVSSTASSDLTVKNAKVMSNTALIGGGLYAASGEIFVRHSLFAQNHGTSTGGAMVISAISSGDVTGNTLDANLSPAAGGVLFGSSPIGAYNNIVANTTGPGIAASGTPPNLSYNLVWNNSGGDYAGCAPGIGSLSADPLFVDPLTDDYHLALHSPAIDAGIPGPLFEDPDGSRGDMGIYGWHDLVMAQPSYPKNLSAALEGGDARLTWNRNPEPDIASYAVYGALNEDFVPSPANFVALVAAADSTVILDPPADSLYYRICAVDTDGYAGGFSDPAFFSTATSIPHEPARYEFALYQNVPNPFNPSTRISYELPARSAVALRVYDVDGRIVRTVVDAEQGPGSFSVEWNGWNDRGHPVASGVYFYRLEAGTRVETRKMVFLK
jgi:hypothetical protein